MEINKEKIKQRISEINESKKEIQRLASFEDQEFWAKKENIAAVKYYLLQAIESLGSICIHIAAKKFSKGVSMFGECFEILEKEELLNKDLALRLKEMAKFRNKLTHRYWETNDEIILKYAREDLKDFDDFIKAIDNLL